MLPINKPAIRIVVLVEYLDLKRVRPTTSVLVVFDCKKISAINNSFHTYRLFTTTSVRIAGLDSGIIILKRILKSLHPSTTAESIISWFMVSKNFVSIYIEKGSSNPV